MANIGLDWNRMEARADIWSGDLGVLLGSPPQMSFVKSVMRSVAGFGREEYFEEMISSSGKDIQVKLKLVGVQ